METQWTTALAEVAVLGAVVGTALLIPQVIGRLVHPPRRPAPGRIVSPVRWNCWACAFEGRRGTVQAIDVTGVEGRLDSVGVVYLCGRCLRGDTHFSRMTAPRCGHPCTHPDHWWRAQNGYEMHDAGVGADAPDAGGNPTWRKTSEASTTPSYQPAPWPPRPTIRKATT